jgi:hypothetical protein
MTEGVSDPSLGASTVASKGNKHEGVSRQLGRREHAVSLVEGLREFSSE